MRFSDITYENLKSGELERELPEFYELKTVIENNPWHDNESTFVHTLAVLEELQKIISGNLDQKLINDLDQNIDTHTRKELLFLATVFHDLGKKETIIKKDVYSFFPKHEEVSVTKAGEILKKIELTGKEVAFVLNIIKNHTAVHSIVSEDNPNIHAQFLELKSMNKEYFSELILMVWADTSSGQLKETEPKNFRFRVGYYKKQLGLSK